MFNRDLNRQVIPISVDIENNVPEQKNQEI